MKIFLCLLLTSSLEYNCQLEFINKIPHDCLLNNWEFWQICHQPNLKYRKRAWNRFKNALPMTRQYDKLIKEIEEIGKESGYIIK